MPTSRDSGIEAARSLHKKTVSPFKQSQACSKSIATSHSGLDCHSADPSNIKLSTPRSEVRPILTESMEYRLPDGGHGQFTKWRFHEHQDEGGKCRRRDAGTHRGWQFGHVRWNCPRHFFACVATRSPDARTGTGTFTSTAITCPTQVCDSNNTFTAELRGIGQPPVPDGTYTGTETCCPV